MPRGGSEGVRDAPALVVVAGDGLGGHASSQAVAHDVNARTRRPGVHVRAPAATAVEVGVARVDGSGPAQANNSVSFPRKGLYRFASQLWRTPRKVISAIDHSALPETTPERIPLAQRLGFGLRSPSKRAPREHAPPASLGSPWGSQRHIAVKAPSAKEAEASTMMIGNTCEPAARPAPAPRPRTRQTERASAQPSRGSSTQDASTRPASSVSIAAQLPLVPAASTRSKDAGAVEAALPETAAWPPAAGRGAYCRASHPPPGPRRPAVSSRDARPPAASPAPSATDDGRGEEAPVQPQRQYTPSNYQDTPACDGASTAASAPQPEAAGAPAPEPARVAGRDEADSACDSAEPAPADVGGSEPDAITHRDNTPPSAEASGFGTPVSRRSVAEKSSEAGEQQQATAPATPRPQSQPRYDSATPRADPMPEAPVARPEYDKLRYDDGDASDAAGSRSDSPTELPQLQPAGESPRPAGGSSGDDTRDSDDDSGADEEEDGCWTASTAAGRPRSAAAARAVAAQQDASPGAGVPNWVRERHRLLSRESQRALIGPRSAARMQHALHASLVLGPTQRDVDEMDAENERSEAVDVRASLPDASGGDGAESGPQTAEDGRFQLTSMLVAKGGDLGPGLCAVGTKLSLQATPVAPMRPGPVVRPPFGAATAPAKPARRLVTPAQASEARDGEEAGDGTPRRKPSVPRFPSRPRAKRQLSFPLAATIGATPREVSKPDVDGPMTARMRVMARKMELEREREEMREEEERQRQERCREDPEEGARRARERLLERAREAERIRRATENGFGSCRAERQLDPEEERRKAQQRVIDRQRRERLEAQAAQAEVMQRRDAALQWRSSIQEKRERHRVEIYALNALLRMSEERRVQALLAAQEDEDDSSVDGYAIEHAV